MARNSVTTTEVETNVSATPIVDTELIIDDTYADTPKPLVFTPVNELLTEAHFRNIPWARPANIEFKDKPSNHSLWAFNSLCRLTILMPQDCWFESEAYVSVVRNQKYVVTALTFEQAEIEVGNDNNETTVDGKTVFSAKTRKVWHIVLRSTDSKGKTHPVGRMMWNVTDNTGTPGINLIGNRSWGVPTGVNVTPQIKSYEKTLIKRAIRAALNGDTRFVIQGTDRTLVQLYNELFEIGNEGSDLPENLNRETSEDVFGDQDTV